MRFSDPRLEPIWDQVRAGKRLDRAAGLTLFDTEDLLGVGRMADHVKRQREGDRVYFVINRHITPTNVCVLSCAFCGFARRPGADGAYEHSIEDMVAMVRGETREVHIVENTQTTEELAVVGIFTPAGSPSAAYLTAEVAATYTVAG